MNLPQKWNILKTRSEEKSTFLFGADYSKISFKYSIYITDLNHVWISDVDTEKLKFKAHQNGIPEDSISNVYETLIDAFESNFNSNDESEISLDLVKLKIDRGIPLELKLNMEKLFNKNNFVWKWNFDLTILPDLSSIAILKNLIFQMQTIIFSLSEYKNDLIKQISHKDSAIRFLTESIDNLNGSYIVNKWAPENSSNQTIIQKFDKNYFDKVWRDKKLKNLENKYIWDTIDSNNNSNVWSYGTNFDLNPNNEFKTEMSPFKKRKVDNNLENLNNDFEVYDINQEKTEESVKEESIKEESSKDSTEKSTPEPQKSPVKKKRTFGVSRKRKVQYKEFSPIKAAKYFHSDE